MNTSLSDEALRTLYNCVVPAPPKVTRAQLLAAALELLERNGREGFTMADVAVAVDVRPPSLYGHFTDRAALLEELELLLWSELTESLASQVIKNRPIETLKAQARAYRRFATRHPNGYALLFDVRSRNAEASVSARAEALASPLSAFAALVGQQQALMAARVLTPFLHGFVSMENSAAFRMGPGVDAAFEYGVDTILRGIAPVRPTPAVPPSPAVRPRPARQKKISQDR